LITALLLLACCAEPAAPPRRSPKALELALRLGPTFSTGAALPNATSDRRVGMGASLGVFYRTRYFLSPFVETGYALLSTGTAFVPRGAPGGPGTIVDRLDAWHAVAGLSYEAWRLRVGLAAGGYSFGLTSRLGGVTSATRATSIGFDAYLALTLLRAPRFFTALELVTNNAPTADLHYFQAALAIHGDFLRW
jgi:hypothetical protein